jgi:hypothetical protein
MFSHFNLSDKYLCMVKHGKSALSIELIYNKDCKTYVAIIFQGPMKSRIYRWYCRSMQCTLDYTGKEQSIHLWSSETAIADEVLYDFLRRMFLCRLSFSAFCTEMTSIYRSVATTSAPFMSKSTFVDCFFSWLSCMRIDFRKSVDPWCKHAPKVLACDGTHVGITMSRLNMKPVESSELDATLAPVHRRYDRVFLAYRPEIDNVQVRTARSYLRYACDKTLSKLKLGSELTEPEEERSKQALLVVSPENCSQLMNNFLDRLYPQTVIVCLARLLSILARDVPVSSLLPFCYFQSIRMKVQDIGQGHHVQKNLQDMHDLCPEVKFLVQASVGEVCLAEIVSFITFLLDLVQQVHAHDLVPAEPQTVAQSYNPESGVAYYFTPTGEQVRKLPCYEMNKIGGNNYDDPPVAGEACKKWYPLVSKKGFCNVFLWFCPIHGHAYGFHLIPGSEGRKDPFASLYKYLPEAPQHIFYDFACSLSEYCLNREPGLRAQPSISNSYFIKVRGWVIMAY